MTSTKLTSRAKPFPPVDSPSRRPGLINGLLLRVALVVLFLFLLFKPDFPLTAMLRPTWLLAAAGLALLVIGLPILAASCLDRRFAVRLPYYLATLDGALSVIFIAAVAGISLGWFDAWLDTRQESFLALFYLGLGESVAALATGLLGYLQPRHKPNTLPDTESVPRAPVPPMVKRYHRKQYADLTSPDE